jgi:hypothetical protein
MSRTKASVVYPAYSPDTAPSDFFLFGPLSGEMASFLPNSSADILPEIHRIVNEISKETLVAVHDERITRLEWITKDKEDCHRTESKKSGAI